MKVSDLIKIIPLTVISGKEYLDKNISGAYISDLLSDVMGNASEGNLWITLQTHQNIVAVASLRELSAIILVKNFQPSKETLQTAKKENIPILSTPLDCFEISGKIYNTLNESNIV